MHLYSHISQVMKLKALVYVKSSCAVNNRSVPLISLPIELVPYFLMVHNFHGFRGW